MCLIKKYYTVIISILISIQGFSQGDFCTAATLLSNVENWCSAKAAYSNASSSNDAGAVPPCWTGIQNDVWFKFKAINDNVLVTVKGEGSTPLDAPQIQIYPLNCSNLNAQGGCKSSGAGVKEVSTYKGGLSKGVVYLIRISSASGSKGNFTLCVKNYPSPDLPGKDCIDATYLCTKDPVRAGKLTGYGNKLETDGTCLYDPQFQSEFNAKWYWWECGESGTLTFDILPLSVGSDFDFVLYELPNGIQNDCPGKMNLRCVASGSPNANSPCSGPTGIKFNDNDISEDFNCDPGENHYAKYIDMVKGKQYALLIDNFTEENGFTLEFGGTGQFKGPSGAFTAVPKGCNAYTYAAEFLDADSYQWNFGEGSTPITASTIGPHTVTYNSQGAKTVTLTVKHSTCEEQFTMDVEIKNTLTAEMSLGLKAPCSPEIQVTTSTDADTYNWEFGSDAIPATSTQKSPGFVSYNSPGLKTVTLKVDKGGCEATTTDTITVNPGLSLSTTISHPEGCDRLGGTNATAVVKVNGGTPPFSYQWSDAQQQTNDTATGLATGEYTIMVTDQNNCTGSKTVIIEDRILIDFTIDSNPCETCNNGQVTANITGSGKPPYTYRWNDPAQQTTATATGLEPGIYTVTVTDANDCRKIDTVTIGGTVGIVDMNKNTGFSLYPNPAEDVVYIASMHKQWNVRIFTASGQVIYNKSLTLNTVKLDLDLLPTGIYFLEAYPVNQSTPYFREKLIIR